MMPAYVRRALTGVTVAVVALVVPSHSARADDTDEERRREIIEQLDVKPVYDEHPSTEELQRRLNNEQDEDDLSAKKIGEERKQQEEPEKAK